MSQFYIKIANGLLEPKHCQAMGEAVWLYMWLQDKCTSVNENGEGKVLGNRPILYETDILPALGPSRHTYVRWVKKLRDAGYIKTLRTPAGLVILITKAKKYGNKGSAINEHHQRSESDVPQTSIAKSDVPKSSRDVPKSKRDVPKSSIQYKTTQDYTKTIQPTTNVVGGDAPARYGKPEINELFDYWAQQCEFNIETRVTANRRAASTLLKKHGKEKLESLIRGVAMTHSDRYAPSISDFTELQQKLPALLVWGKKKMHGELEDRPTVWKAGKKK